MRALAMTGMVTASWISTILSGSAIRATPPSARMSAGTRSSAITATAPASSAIRAWSAVVTSMITPPLSISARPLFTRIVPISTITPILARSVQAPAAMSWGQTAGRVPPGRVGCQARDTADEDTSALQAGEDVVHLLLRRGDRPEEDCVLLRPHHVADVWTQLLRSKAAEGALDAEGVVRVLAEGDSERVTGLECSEPPVRGVRGDNADLGRIDGDAVPVLAQAVCRRLG